MTDNVNYIPDINPEDYSYDLPKERIAEFPLPDRSGSRLLVARASDKSISHYKFKDITALLPENSLLVVNSTRVIAARLKMVKSTGGRAEILCIEPVLPSADPQVAMAARSNCVWKCIVGGPRVRKDTLLVPEAPSAANIELKAKILEKSGNEALVRFSWQPPELPFASVIESTGRIPLPPYIKRDTVESDAERYQTVYAHYEGSVAAPTAGLHFTPEIMDSLDDKSISTAEVTLHVGPGTFKPIESGSISGHEMHSERISVSIGTVKKLLDRYDSYNKIPDITATGTTSLRTLETLYWIGAQMYCNEFDSGSDYEFFLGQWEPYRLEKTHELPTAGRALVYLLNWMQANNLDHVSGRTQILIVPGYRFRIVNRLITNYHMPKSTLILLVAAFLGGDFWHEVYDSALSNGYRFLSYGDASLLISD